MEILEIIDSLEEKIEKAFNIPILHRSLIDKEDLLADIEDIRLQLPEELKQARWLKEERKRIIAEANQEAEGIIKAAEEKRTIMVNEHEITKKAYDQANEIVNAAGAQSKDMKEQAVAYCEEILSTMESKFKVIVQSLNESRSELVKRK